MSVLSASGHLNPVQAEEYSAALLGLLGSANPIHVLRDTPGLLRQELDLIPPSLISRREAPGKWSARMVIAHLADSELVGAFRLRLILAQERPALSPYDQDAWANNLDYEQADVEACLERFSVLRRANLAFWAEASPKRLGRVGIHGERGEESVDRMRHLYAGHDLAHLKQLSRIRILLTGH